MRRSSSDLRFSQGGIATTLLRASSGLRSRLMYSTARCCSSTSMNLGHFGLSSCSSHFAAHRMQLHIRDGLQVQPHARPISADDGDVRFGLSFGCWPPSGKGWGVPSALQRE